jgi:hypothetical protein
MKRFIALSLASFLLYTGLRVAVDVAANSDVERPKLAVPSSEAVSKHVPIKFTRRGIYTKSQDNFELEPSRRLFFLPHFAHAAPSRPALRSVRSLALHPLRAPPAPDFAC